MQSYRNMANTKALVPLNCECHHSCQLSQNQAGVA